MKLKVIIHQAEEGGFWAEVPALPGCATQADTLPELEARLREAIEVWLEAAADLAGAKPDPHDKTVEVRELAL